MLSKIIPFKDHPLMIVLEKFQYANPRQKKALTDCYFSEVMPEFGLEKTCAVLKKLHEMSDMWPHICYFYDIIKDNWRTRPGHYKKIRNYDRKNLENYRRGPA